MQPWRWPDYLSRGPKAVALTRQLFWESTHRSFEDQLKREQAAQSQAGATADFREGLAAFFEKRDPQIQGRISAVSGAVSWLGVGRFSLLFRNRRLPGHREGGAGPLRQFVRVVIEAIGQLRNRR